MGRPSAPPKDGSSAAPSSAKPNAKPNAAKQSSKARDKKGGGKGGGKSSGGGESPAPDPPAPAASLFPALPLPILRVSLAAPSPLASPAASTCGATALSAISAALVNSSGSLAAAGDVRRTLGAAVAEWVKALGGGGADGGGGGGVVDNVGRYVAAEIAALPANDEGADTSAAIGSDAADATALGVLLSGKVEEFGERRIVAACQVVGAATAEAVLQSGDEVVVWGVGAQPEVVAALERGGGGLAVAAKRQGAVVAVLTVSLAFGADGRLRERRPWPRTPAAAGTVACAAAGRAPAGVVEDVIDPQWIDYVVTEHGVIAPSMAPQVDKAFNSFA